MQEVTKGGRMGANEARLRERNARKGTVRSVQLTRVDSVQSIFEKSSRIPNETDCRRLTPQPDCLRFNTTISAKVYRGRTVVCEILLQVGVLLHQARSGRLIFRLTRELKSGVVLVDERGRKLGKVIELIGPVRAPYASVVPATSRAGKAGDPAFITG